MRQIEHWGLAMQDELLNEARAHFNEPILVAGDLCRCVGYAEDNEDCYVIVRDPRRGLVWSSFVGGFMSLDLLKGQGCVVSTQGEKWNDFTRLDTLLELNGAPKEAEFILRVEDAALLKKYIR